jgi:hypothetical protein
VYAVIMTQGESDRSIKVNASEKSSVLEGLYYVLYSTAQNHADNADTDEATRIIRKEASKLLTKIQKLQRSVA